MLQRALTVGDGGSSGVLDFTNPDVDEEITIAANGTGSVVTTQRIKEVFLLIALSGNSNTRFYVYNDVNNSHDYFSVSTAGVFKHTHDVFVTNVTNNGFSISGNSTYISYVKVIGFY